MYEAEQIPWTPVDYISNEPTIGLLHAKKRGVMPLLDEETRLAKGTDANFANRVQVAPTPSVRLSTSHAPSAPPLSGSRALLRTTTSPWAVRRSRGLALAGTAD